MTTNKISSKNSWGRVAGLFVKPKTPGERGLPKRPVDFFRVNAEGATGDFNDYRTRKLSGDPDQALLIMTQDNLEWIRRSGFPVAPGHLGENILLADFVYEDLIAGVQLRLGGALLEISKPAEPCNNLRILSYVGEARLPDFLKLLLNRRGWFARVLEGGEVRKGEGIFRPTLP